MNGAWVPMEQLRLPLWDYGVVQGVTVTDMVRTFGGVPFRMDDHLRRFRESCDAVGIELPEADGEIGDILTELAARAVVPGSPREEIAIVCVATPGPNPAYAGFAEMLEDRPTLAIHPLLLDFPQFFRGYRDGVALTVSAVQQLSPASVSPAIKHRSRLHWFLAARQSQMQSAGRIPLLLDAEGFVTETAAANVLVVLGDRLVAPRREATLRGVSLQVVEELLAARQLTVERGDLRVDDLHAADEVLLTSTTSCLLPVTSIDGEPVKNGRPGRHFRQLLRDWSDRVGFDIAEQAARWSPSR